MRTNEILKLNPPESSSWAGKVTLSIGYPDTGWIQLAVTCTAYVQGIIICVSNVFDPFPRLIHWLQTIAEGALPSECTIDEEGDVKILRALPASDDEFIFQISERLYGEDQLKEEPIFMYVKVGKKQFLSEFLKRWDDFLENQYDPVYWEEYGAHLRNLDVSKIRAYLGE
jgi:hypothetical protein